MAATLSLSHVVLQGNGLWKNNYGLWKNNLLTLPQTQDFSWLHCYGTDAANCGHSDGHIQ